MAGSAGVPPEGMTLVGWVTATLREDIASGRHSPDEPFVTQREIVERFGVSTTTAVAALRELAADGLVVRRRGRGTFVAPDAEASSTTQRPVLTSGARVAFVHPNDVDPHQVAIRAGIAAECARHGHTFFQVSTGERAAEVNALHEAAGSGADGIIVYLHDRSSAGSTVEEIQRSWVHVVLVDRYLPTVPTDAVIFDDFAIGYAVTRAVLERGHRDVAVLWGEEDVTSVRDRLSGHYRALRESGLAELPARSGLRDYAGQTPARRLARLSSLLTPPEAITAIIGGSASIMGLAASDLLDDTIELSSSVELANMDELGPFNVSPLASVSATLPTREMGARAMALLAERLAGSREALRHVVLEGRVNAIPRERNTLSVTGRRGSPVSVQGPG